MKRKIIFITAATMAFFLSGCATIREHTMPAEKNLISGAGSIFAKDESATKFEKLDLSTLMKDYELSDRNAVSLEANNTTSRYAYLRNEMQDRIIASSNQRCGNYLREIISAKSQSQMGWGTLSLLLSGAASVTTPIKAAQTLAAGGAFAAGTNALYNESYFNSLAVGVIASGITKNRESILERIQLHRKQSLLDYPVNMAVADAIAYHSSCNILIGLETASNALKQVSGSNQSQVPPPLPTVSVQPVIP